ncbi:hypothetical protein BDN72DRAFT_746915, partial [Pluteus cervinus]
VWRQFLFDVINKVSNKRSASAPSYCRLSQADRTSVTENTYQDRRLSNIFFDCQWRYAEGKEWSNNFDRLWPKKDAQLRGKVQNYLQMNYYTMWSRLKELAKTEERVEQLRKQIKKRYNKLYWMPLAASDRIWVTR